MGTLWGGGRISCCQKCELIVICRPQADVFSVSASSWSWNGRGRRHLFLNRSISSRRFLLRSVKWKATRASHQDIGLPLRGDNGVLPFDGAVLEGGALGLSASFVGEEDPRARLKGRASSKAAEKEAVRRRTQRLEQLIERAIFNCRFFTIMAVVGSLAGSLLCFIKGSCFILDSFRVYLFSQLAAIHSEKVILLLVEAVDVYLMGTVMLIFGMGVYELFISSLEIAGETCDGKAACCGSNLFGLFRLSERPKWLEIRSLDELKTKLGHVIVMILLVGMFEKSKKVPVKSGVDLMCFAASILLASGSLFLLSKLHKDGPH